MMDARVISIWANLPPANTVKANKIEVPFKVTGSMADGSPVFSKLVFEKKMICGRMQWPFPYDFRRK